MNALDSPLVVACLVTGVALTFKYYCALLATYAPVPEAVRSKGREAVWWNISVSLTHSTVSSVLLLYAIQVDEDFLSDMKGHYTRESLLAAAFSFGYFIHDSLHIITTHRLADNLGILLHHAIMLGSLGKVLHNRRYINTVCVALLCEISSVLLHARQLVKMSRCRWSAGGRFALLKSVNVAVYAAVRFGVIVWLYCWWFEHHTHMQPTYRAFYFAMLTLMTCVNVVYFLIIIQKDFLAGLFASSAVAEKKDQ